MIAPALILALSLAASSFPPPNYDPAHGRSCTPNPTITPRPTGINCYSQREDQIVGDWRCDRSTGTTDGVTKDSWQWAWVAKPKPAADSCNPSTVATTSSGYCCKCADPAPRLRRFDYQLPCEGQLSEKTDY